MSTIKSSDEHLTLNADGSSKDIKFQANGVEKASISSAGAFTSTTIDATKLTGNLPAISGAALTGVGVAGITSTADATAITIDSNEDVGIGAYATTPPSKLYINNKTYPTTQANAGQWQHCAIGIPSTTYVGDKCVIGLGGGSTNTATDYAASYIGHENKNNGNQGYGDLIFGTRHSTTPSVQPTERLRITSDGRGLSQFTAKAWASWEIDGGSPSLYDSHNVSSVVDNGTGDSTINFSNNMANTNYAVAGMSDDTFRGLSLRDYTYTNVAYTRFASWISSNTTYDDAHKLMAIWFGD